MISVQTVKECSLDPSEIARNERILRSLLNRGTSRKTLQINFRELFPNMTVKNRATHLIHRYPAKLIYHIPYLFIHNNLLTYPNDTILDVFCGSGTVLIESMIAHRNCKGVEINPIARLIAKVKTRPLENNSLMRSAEQLLECVNQNIDVKIPVFPNVDFWFNKDNQAKLAKIKQAIEACQFEEDIRDFFMITFSSIVRRASNADPSISPPVFTKLMHERVKKGRVVDIFKIFKDELSQNILRMSDFSNRCNGICNSNVLEGDARKCLFKAKSANLAITSPPYMSAQKYFRSLRLEYFWLDQGTVEEFRDRERMAIGTDRIEVKEYSQLMLTGIREVDRIIRRIYQKNKKRAYIVARYFFDMRLAIREVYRILRDGSYFIIVVGNNTVVGFTIPSFKIFSQIALDEGFSLKLTLVDEIKSRGLMTRRNKTAGLINSEWILVLKKGWN